MCFSVFAMCTTSPLEPIWLATRCPGIRVRPLPLRCAYHVVYSIGDVRVCVFCAGPAADFRSPVARACIACARVPVEFVVRARAISCGTNIMFGTRAMYARVYVWNRVYVNMFDCLIPAGNNLSNPNLFSCTRSLTHTQRGSDELLSQAAVMAPASDNNNQDLATKKAKLESGNPASVLGGVGKCTNYTYLAWHYQFDIADCSLCTPTPRAKRF